jgi:hypothetical protein
MAVNFCLIDEAKSRRKPKRENLTEVRAENDFGQNLFWRPSKHKAREEENRKLLVGNSIQRLHSEAPSVNHKSRSDDISGSKKSISEFNRVAMAQHISGEPVR